MPQQTAILCDTICRDGARSLSGVLSALTLPIPDPPIHSGVVAWFLPTLTPALSR